MSSNKWNILKTFCLMLICTCLMGFASFAAPRTDEISTDSNISPNHTNLTIKKTWEDADGNLSSPGTESVEIIIYNDENEFERVTLSDRNDWSFTMSVPIMPVEGGRKFKYTVEEANVPEGYEANVLANLLNEDEYTFEVINKKVGSSDYNDNLIDINISKVWEDEDGNSIRWPSVIEELEVHVLDENGRKVGDSIFLTADEPSKYAPWREGFTVEEVTELHDFTTELDITANGIYITNKLLGEEDYANIYVRKIWLDEDGDPINPPVDEITVDIYADGIIMESFVLGEHNGWENAMTLPSINNEGESYVFTVKEKGVPDNYESIVDQPGDYKFIIKNQKKTKRDNGGRSGGGSSGDAVHSRHSMFVNKDVVTTPTATEVWNWVFDPQTDKMHKDGIWYWRNQDGKNWKGWMQHPEDKEWYYFDMDSAKMYEGDHIIDGKEYSFRFKQETPIVNYVKQNGVWTYLWTQEHPWGSMK